MGWTGLRATHHKANGTVDRKAECDAYWIEGLNAGHFEILKSTMIGGTYYAAVSSVVKRVKTENGDTYVPIPKEQREVFAVVMLTSVDNKDYYDFHYKEMDETCGPAQSDCPASILKLLTPTTNQYALGWRERCVENAKRKKLLSSVKIGGKISYIKDGKEVILIKHPPAYQFKTAFWYCAATHQYVKANAIPKDFKVL